MTTYVDSRVKVTRVGPPDAGVVKGLRIVDLNDHFWFGTEMYAFDADGSLEATGWFSNELLNDHRVAGVIE